VCRLSLILRSRASGVSKDEANYRGLMVRDAPKGAPHHEENDLGRREF
jgi:hypothetical protein